MRQAKNRYQKIASLFKTRLKMMGKDRNNEIETKIKIEINR